MKTHFYDEIYADKDYKKESLSIVNLIKEVNPDCGSLLDLCCGTGKHLSFLQKYFDCEGVDLNKKMADVARGRTKAKIHIQNMENLLLNKKFDIIICLFGSIAYNLSFDGLCKTVGACKKHLNQGGSLIVEPFVYKNFLKTGLYKRTVGDINIESEVSLENDICVLNKTYYFPHETKKRTYKLSLFSDNEYVSAFEKCNLCVQKKMFPEGNFQVLYVGKLDN